MDNDRLNHSISVARKMVEIGKNYNLSDVKKYCEEIICYYSDNDPYVKYEKEKEFADTIATV